MLGMHCLNVNMKSEELFLIILGRNGWLHEEVNVLFQLPHPNEGI